MPTAFPLSADPFSTGSNGSAAEALEPSNSLGDRGDRMKEFNAKIDSETAAHEAAVTKDRAENQRIESDFFAKNAPPAYKPQAPYVEPKATNPIQEWGSFAMMFAMLASHFTRTPMITAMNAGSAVMNAFKEKDMEKAKASYAQWKDANEQSYKLYEYQRDAYKDLLESVKDRVKNNIDLTKEETADYRARIAAIGSAFKDQTSLDMLEQNGVLGWAKLQEQRDKTAASMAEKQAALEIKMDEISQKYDGAKKQADLVNDPAYINAVKSGDPLTVAEKLNEVNPTEKNAALLEKVRSTQDALVEKSKESAAKIDMLGKQLEEKTKTDEAKQKVAEDRLKLAEKGGRGYSQPLEPEQIEENAQLMADLKLPMATPALAGRNNTWEQANLRAVEIAESEGKKGFGASWYDAAKKQRLDAAAGPSAKGIRYLTVAVNHLDSMEAAVMALPNNSDIRLFSRIFNAAANQVNDSNLAVEQVNGQIVGNEVAKAISGAGNLSMEEREKLDAMFDPSRGKESLLEIIHATKGLLAGQVAGYTTQFGHYAPASDVTGIPEDTMRKLFVDPATGQVSEDLLKWDQQRQKALLSGQPEPPRPNLKAFAPAQGVSPAVGSATSPTAGVAPLGGPQGATKSGVASDGRRVWFVPGKGVVDEKGALVQ